MSESLATYNARYLNDPNNANSSAATISRLSNEGENAFAVEYPCILKRIAPAVSLNQSLVTLPDDVKSIRRVSWLGFKMDPLGHRNFREVFQNATQQGRPFWYIFNNVGQNIIQIFPAANQAISSAVNDLWGAAIPNQLIIEYWQTPDFSTAILPSYIRRRLLKTYILRGCFNIEGQGQNLKARDYFKNRWLKLKEDYGNLLGDLCNKPRKLVVNGITSSYFFPGHPILPIDKFGESVDAGE